MLTSIFNKSLIQSSTRLIKDSAEYSIYLDKNEQAEDVEAIWKKKVLDKMIQTEWNRYPSTEYKDIESKIATQIGLNTNQVVLSSGSASLITALLNYFSINNKKIFITQPSYSLFDYHCRTYNIPYTPWMLTDELQYDYGRFPNLDNQSVLIITSPNNPVGNVMDLNQLEFLLNLYPQSLIIVDNVYNEFCEYNYIQLLSKYTNLMIIRSFSKAYPIAGLRLGYLCASADYTCLVRKLLLSFSITEFSLCFAREVLFDDEFIQRSQESVNVIIAERIRLQKILRTLFSTETVEVLESQGNFILLRFRSFEHYSHLKSCLQRSGIKILDCTEFPKLKNSIRISIGKRSENDLLLSSIIEFNNRLFYTESNHYISYN